ncbi:hypothetical protein NUW58_g1630 [Xylaria curta]|uniref:Uncharacterized protein n=1 Tax=Xylaria curta TaxID=42375 RepID=A0ACC1PJW2_9PEZI|nr:hypothetical protein NUW58_g1630 [Xylaria curta]
MGREQELSHNRYQWYSPPQDIYQYASRALPSPPTPVPTQPRSFSASRSFGEGHSRQHTPEPLFIAKRVNNGPRTTAFGGGMNEEVLMTRWPQHVKVPEDSQLYDDPPLVSPQPQRPESKLLSMWENGDELVSPIDTPEAADFAAHVVSPLSEDSGRWASSATGQAPMEYESWFDDTSSDEEERPESPDQAPQENQFTDDTFPRMSQVPFSRTSFRYSDPGSPLSPDLDWDFGEPGPDVGGFDYASGRQTVQAQVYTLPTLNSDAKTHSGDGDIPVGEPRVSLEMPHIATFLSNGARAGQLRVPPPLELGQQPLHIHENSAKAPYPLRTSSVSSQRSMFRSDRPSSKQHKRRSGLGGFGSPRFRKPPPGFTEVFSQIDYQGSVSTVPRVKNMLSKAKHGLGLGSDESKKEKRREDLKRQVLVNTEE